MEKQNRWTTYLFLFLAILCHGVVKRIYRKSFDLELIGYSSFIAYFVDILISIVTLGSFCVLYTFLLKVKPELFLKLRKKVE